MFKWLHTLLGGSSQRGDSDAIHCPEGAWVEPKGHDFSYPVHVPVRLLRSPEFLTRHGLTLDSKLSDASKAEVPANLRLTPEARSAAVARGNRTRAAKRAMTEKLRSELQRSVEEA